MIEIRKVPKNWQHPVNEQGEYIPMHEMRYVSALNEWIKKNKLTFFKSELQFKFDDELLDDVCKLNKPLEKDYNTYYAPAFATHFQIYEKYTFGTPISPVFSTKEEANKHLSILKLSLHDDLQAKQIKYAIKQLNDDDRKISNSI